jgi:hypothetical protein
MIEGDDTGVDCNPWANVSHVYLGMTNAGKAIFEEYLDGLSYFHDAS